MSADATSGEAEGTASRVPPEISPRELLEIAHGEALAAGALLLESYLSGHARGVDSKSTPTDLVSDADRLAERAIREGLALRRPYDGFLGEESDVEQQGSSGLRWVVDPLDGTVNFLFGIPQWAVSIAVQDERGTLAGVVHDPVRGDTFSAVRDGGPPTLETPAGSHSLSGEPAAQAGRTLTLKGSECDELARAMVATGFAYDSQVRAAQARVLTRVIPRVRDIRRFGSAALDLAWTAAGRYDAYFERTVKAWDIAAGALICEAAGLRVVELPVHEDLPWGILVAPAGLCEELLELVGGPG
ncbi:MAG TPA: inositol monophosphatase family protein [Solirubrobacteraceae bacterium]